MDIHRDQGKEPVEQEAPPRPVKRGGRKKPWKLEYRTRRPWGRGWSRSGRGYETEKRARQAYDTQVRKAKARGARWAWDWRLINPDGEAIETFLASDLEAGHGE